MEWLVKKESVWSRSGAARGEGGLEQPEEDDVREQPHQVLRGRGVLAEKHKERKARIENPLEIETVVGPEHQPEVFGQNQGLEAGEQRILRALGHRAEAAEEVEDRRLAGVGKTKRAERLVPQDPDH